LSRLRQFAASNQLQFLILNIDAFNKSVNIIHRQQEALSGRRPIEFIQACRPIVIIDEPQNMEGEQARQALETLSATCTLRYSATHRNVYNLVYRLDPVRAYDLRLVKRIEIDSVLEEADFNRAWIKVESIVATRAKVTATLSIDALGPSGVGRRSVRISKGGVDLYELSGEREPYRGYIVDHVDAASGYVAFTNGLVLSTGDAQGGNRDDLMKAQVTETVHEHFEKELSVRRKLPEGRRLKVLSLIFIDRVANYVPEEGKIRRWFVDAYAELSAKPRYAELRLPSVEAAHNGYFAVSKGRPKDTSGETSADDEAYVLIMRDKERLLSLDEPLRFIFSHSALREGWDNPNVFQLCTLNETKSDLKKRQEIGRGLRLPVDESGDRCTDPSINRLTVIANESYDDFARDLQKEIEEESGVVFEGRISNRRERKAARLKKGWRVDAEFVALWERIKHKTRYAVTYKTVDLIEKAAKTVADMLPVAGPSITAKKVDLRIAKDGVVVDSLLSVRARAVETDVESIPDAIGYLQRETELTRGTIAEILIRSGRLSDLLVDPQEFLDRALRAVRQTMQEYMVAGIKYERIDGSAYEMYLFEQQELESYVSRLMKVERSIYDVIECESEVERRFARELDAREDIDLFLKLPRWFKVETPLGTYNPDWGIVKAGKLYLVRETKATLEELRLRGVEWGKIQCGKAHFDELGVDFMAVTSAHEV